MRSYLNWGGKIFVLFLASDGDCCLFSDQRERVREMCIETEGEIAGQIVGWMDRHTTHLIIFLAPVTLGKIEHP